MVDLKQLYNNGVKAFPSGESLYDLFSGFPVKDYVGKVYAGTTERGKVILMETWFENGERAWRVIA